MFLSCPYIKTSHFLINVCKEEIQRQNIWETAVHRLISTSFAQGKALNVLQGKELLLLQYYPLTNVCNSPKSYFCLDTFCLNGTISILSLLACRSPFHDSWEIWQKTAFCCSLGDTSSSIFGLHNRHQHMSFRFLQAPCADSGVKSACLVFSMLEWSIGLHNVTSFCAHSNFMRCTCFMTFLRKSSSIERWWIY